MVKKEICHVCGKEKKPYAVFITNEILDLLNYEQAREDGPICQRCDRYFAMTGKFKDATKEEFEIAKKASWFARMMLKWWEKDKEIYSGEAGDYYPDNFEQNNREWEGIASLSKWCRKELTPKSNQDQQPGEKANIQGEGGCTDASAQGVKSGFESSGTDSKKPSVDSFDKGNRYWGDL